MENKVEMTLEEYTKLVVENDRMKRVLETYKKKILNQVGDKISDSLIYRLNKEETINLLNETDNWKILNKVNVSSWSAESIANNNYEIMTKEEVEREFIERIKYIANEHLNNLLEEEKGATA